MQFAAVPIQHPEVTRIVEECRLLKEQMAQLLAEREDLLHVTIPNLQAEYQVQIGRWEVELFQLQVELNRLKRIRAIFQAAVNRNQTVEPTAVMEQVEAEFAKWKAKVEEKLDDLDRAKSHLNNLLPEEESREIRKIYLKLVKALHPDLHPGQTEDARKMWRRVAQVWESGNYAELKVLWLMVKDQVPVEDAVDPIADLESERDELIKGVWSLLDEIAGIESGLPYSVLINVDDTDWVSERQRELKASIANMKKRIEELEPKVNQLLGLGLIKGMGTIH